MDNPGATPAARDCDLRRTQSTGCAGEKVGHILAVGFPQRNPQAASTCLWKRVRAVPSARSFPQIPNGRVLTVHRHAETCAAGSAKAQRGSPVKRAADRTPAGYHSPVCSNTGDAIDRIAAAIDQLASDARERAPRRAPAELSSAGGRPLADGQRSRPGTRAAHAAVHSTGRRRAFSLRARRRLGNCGHSDFPVDNELPVESAVERQPVGCGSRRR